MKARPVSLVVDMAEPLDPFVKHLAKLGYARTADDVNVDRVVQFRGGRPSTAILFVRPRGTPDTGWLAFVGPAALERATDFVDVVQFLPREMMHLLARGAGSETQRVVALRVLRAELSAGPRWDATIEATLRAALRDTHPDVRLEAAVCALGVDAGRGRVLVAEVAATEADAEVRAALERGLAAAPDDPPVAAATERDAIVPASRLAIPLALTEPLGAILARVPAAFPREAPIASRDRVFKRAVLRDTSGDAHAVLVAHATARLGCAYFTGGDHIGFAARVASAFRSYPVELASRVAREGARAERRGRALFAVALAASERFVSGAHGVDEARAIIGMAAQDEATREAATRAAELLP